MEKTILVGCLIDLDECHLICGGFDKEKIQIELNKALEIERKKDDEIWQGKWANSRVDFTMKTYIAEIKLVE